MKNLRNDKSGTGSVIVMVVIIMLLGIFLVVPFVLGWAVTFLMHILTGNAEITAFWTRWFVGLAVFILGSFLIPNVNPLKTVNNYYTSEGKDFHIVVRED